MLPENLKPDQASSLARLFWWHTRGRNSCSETGSVPLVHAGLKDERFPQFSPAACGGFRKSAPHSPALPVARTIPDPAIPSRPLASSFTLKELRR